MRVTENSEFQRLLFEVATEHEATVARLLAERSSLMAEVEDLKAMLNTTTDLLTPSKLRAFQAEAQHMSPNVDSPKRDSDGAIGSSLYLGSDDMELTKTQSITAAFQKKARANTEQKFPALKEYEKKSSGKKSVAARLSSEAPEDPLVKAQKLAEAAAIRVRQENGYLQIQPVEHGKDHGCHPKYFVTSGILDQFVACVLVFNCVLMIIESHIIATETLYMLNAGTRDPAIEDLKRMVSHIDFAFIAMYLIEFVLKIAFLKCAFFQSRLNLFDGLILVLTLAEPVIRSWFPGNPNVLRFFRIGKIFRMTRFLRYGNSESLSVLTRSLNSSIGALFWTLVFMLGFVGSFSLLLCQLLVAYLQNQDQPQEERYIVYYKYGTFTRSLLTVCELTLGNWGPPTWLLVDNVSEWFMPLLLSYKMLAGFAMLNVITAVFLRQTMKSADTIDEFTLQQAAKSKDQFSEQLLRLFDALDVTGDGFLSHLEFEALLTVPDVCAWLDMIGIDTSDVSDLFRAVDDGDGVIDCREFLKGFSQLRGGASAVDAMSLKNSIKKLSTRLDVLSEDVSVVLNFIHKEQKGHEAIAI